MQVSEIMTREPAVLSLNTSIGEAASRMRELNTGFMPVGSEGRLTGIITDRDLVTRGIGNGASLDQSIADIETQDVFCCNSDQDVNDALQKMQENRVQRLVVLDSAESMNVVGIITLGDIASRGEPGEVRDGVVECCKHYH